MGDNDALNGDEEAEAKENNEATYTWIMPP